MCLRQRLRVPTSRKPRPRRQIAPRSQMDLRDSGREPKEGAWGMAERCPGDCGTGASLRSAAGPPYCPESRKSIEIAVDQALIKDRYVQFLTGTNRTFAGGGGGEPAIPPGVTSERSRALWRRIVARRRQGVLRVSGRCRLQGGGGRLFTDSPAVPAVVGVWLLCALARQSALPEAGGPALLPAMPGLPPCSRHTGRHDLP